MSWRCGLGGNRQQNDRIREASSADPIERVGLNALPIFTMPPPWLPSVHRRLNPETKEIRLLSIYCANSLTALIEYNIQVFELDKASPFYALSYVWGKTDVTAEIQFCG
jgi:hypothetical protein